MRNLIRGRYGHPSGRTERQDAQPTKSKKLKSRASTRRKTLPANPPGLHPPSTPSAEPSAPPSELNCRHFSSCSGCTLDDQLSTPPLLRRAVDFFQTRGHPEFPLHAGPQHFWRHRARLAVRSNPSGHPCLGLFAAGTHDVVDIPHCPIHHPAINAAAELIRDSLVFGLTEPYNESTGGGDLRYVQLSVVDVDGGEPCAQQQGEQQHAVQVVLVWNADGRATADPKLSSFAETLWKESRRQGNVRLHSVHANFQPHRTNAILGAAWECLHGEGEAWASIDDVRVSFDPGAFMQANPSAMAAVLASMRRWVPPGSNLVDLHAGVGTIALSLAATQRLRAVRAVEISPTGEAAFWRSWQRLRLALGGQGAAESADGDESEIAVEYVVAAAGSDPGRWLAGADVAVVDPPRKGLEPALLSHLCERETSLERLMYLSCGWPAFERDCGALLDSGVWKLRHSEGFLFFPGADHVETLAVFDRE